MITIYINTKMLRNHLPNDNWWVNRPYLFVGRIAPNKGLDHILAAWSELDHVYGDRCPALWIAGGLPDEIAAFRSFVKGKIPLEKYECRSRIHWWGYLDPPGISALLLRSLVLITHSSYEPGGRVVLEAMSEGVPAIATPHGFAAELIRDWVNGFLVPFGDIDALSHRMEHFLLQPYLRSELGLNAKADALAALSAWKFLDSHCAVYEAALSCSPISRELTPYLSSHRRPADRAVGPIYPYTEPAPTEESIIAFVSRQIAGTVKDFRRDDHSRGSSIRWLFSCSGQRWLVKWPYTRLETRPLWDGTWRGGLVRTARQRLDTELFATTFPGMVSHAGADRSKHLLTRVFCESLPPFPDPLAALSALLPTLMLLNSTPVPHAAKKIFPLLDRDWQQEPFSIAGRMARRVRGILSQGEEAWNENEPSSLRLSWRLYLGELLHRRRDLNDDLRGALNSAITQFQEMSNLESNVSTGISHGACILDHFVQWGDSYGLIDGEHVHPAWIGEDIARFIISLIDLHPSSAEREIWTESLRLISSCGLEARVVLSWAALRTLQGIMRNASLLRRSRLEFHLHRWKVLRTLAADNYA